MNNLEYILSQIVYKKGVDILSEKRLIYILMDYHAFDNLPPLKRLFTDMISDSICRKFVNVKNNEAALSLEINKYKNKLALQYGYNKAIIDLALDAIRNIIISTKSLKEPKYNKKDELIVNKQSIENQSRINEILTGKTINKEAVSFIVGDEVKEIGESAFEDMTQLSDILLPNTIERIHRYAFCGCNNLHCIKLPQSLEVIDDYAFYKSGIEEIHIKSDKITLGNYLFGTDAVVRLLFYSANVRILPNAFWGATIDVGIPRGKKDEFMPLIRQGAIQSHVRDFAYFDPIDN